MADLSLNGVGYTTVDRVNTDFTLEQDLGFLLDGLSVHARLAFDNSSQEIDAVSTIQPTGSDDKFKWIDPETGKEYTNVTVDANYKFDYQNNIAWMTSAGSVDNNATYRRLNYSVQLNYANSFGLHNVGAMGNFSREEYSIGSRLPTYRENWVFRTTYDFDRRYMLEYNGAYNGSEIFSPENRFAFFQSGAVGWMFSEEPFIKNLDWTWMDMLKFRASYGQIGDDNINGRWLFMDTWEYGGAFNHGITGCGPFRKVHTSGIMNHRLVTRACSGGSQQKLDIAADYSLFGGVISGSLDYFKENRSNILLS